MNKRDKVNELLNELLNQDLLDDTDIYKKIVNYKVIVDAKNIKKNETTFLDKYKNKLEYNFCEKKKVISFGNYHDNDMKIELILSVRDDKYVDGISKVVSYLIRKKISYYGKYLISKRVNNLIIVVGNKSDAICLIEYINSRLSNYFYNANCLGIANTKVSVSLHNEYDYYEVFAMHLKMYIDLVKDNKNNIDFKKYLIDSYCDIKKCRNLERYLWFNRKKVKLSLFFENIREMTLVLFKRLCNDDVIDFLDCLKKEFFNQKENIYIKYDDNSGDKELLFELLLHMCLKYGEKEACENILNYKESKKIDYITRSNNLRKKVVNSLTFMVYLYSIDLEKEIDKIICNQKDKRKKKILEDVCKEIFLSCQNEDMHYSGKIQVARSLIRISYGDFSTITRTNGARKLAIDNIKPEEIIGIIKGSLQIDRFIKESQLYEMYAEYIQSLCLNMYA